MTRRDQSDDAWACWLVVAIIFAVALVLVGLGSCGSPRVPPAAPPLPTSVVISPAEASYPPVVVDVTVERDLTYRSLATLWLPRPCWGLTSVNEAGGGTIRLDAGMDADRVLARRVAFHEVGHALRRWDGRHEPDTSCFLYESALPGQPAPLVPCAAELAAVRASVEGRTWVLRVRRSGHPRIYEGVARAVEGWNVALGRECIVIADPP